jgi:hypothetical protein
MSGGHPKQTIRAKRGWNYGALRVAVTHLLFAESTVNSARDGIAGPDDEPEQDDGEDQLKGVDHDSRSPVISL